MIALGLSVLIGFAMPIGDVALAAPALAAPLKADDETATVTPDDSAEAPAEGGGSEGAGETGGANDGGSTGADGDAGVPGTDGGTASDADTQGAESIAENPIETPSSEAPLQPRTLADSIMPMAAGDPISCSYGNTGGGQYKDTLCWFDLSYMNGLTKTPINTQWVETYITPDSQMTVGNGCTRTGTGGTFNPYVVTCTATSTWASAMDAAYGSNTQTRSVAGSSSTNATTALTNGRNAARDAARNAARTGLYSTGGLYYGNVTDYPIDVTLPNSDYRFTALLDITAPAATAVRNVRSVAFPTWSGAFLGNNGFYTGVTGYPALYQQTDAGGTGVTAANRTTTTTFKQIRMYQGATPVNGYSVVVADAESTDTNESLTFSHSGASGMQWLPNNPTAFWAVPAASTNTNNDARRDAAVGSTVCQGSVSTYRSQWASINAPNPTVCSGSSTTKNGTAMLQVLAPSSPTANWSVTQAMTGGGLQGVAFGVLMARASLTVNVADRVIDSTGNPTTANFQATVTPTGSTASTASTGPSGSTGTASPSFPVLAEGTQLNYANVPNAFDSSYTQAWQCTKTGGTATEYWPGPGSTQTSATPPPTNTAWFNLLPGYYIACNVTYTPPYVTLVKDVNQNGTAAANIASHWNLTVAGTGAFVSTTSNSTGPGTAPAAAGVKRPIAVNSANAADVYTLTEAGPNTSPWVYGYDWTGLTCVANPGSTAFPSSAYTETKNPEGQVTAATLKVAKGNDLRCTYTNTANKPELMVKKEAFAAPGNTPANLLPWGTAVVAASTVYYRVTFDNSQGTAPMSVGYTDYLGDVLDDASFNTGSLRYGDGAETGYAGASTSPHSVTVTDQHSASIPTLVFGGTVPARAIRTVWFSVTTFANDHEAATRTEGFTRGSGVTNEPNRVGYALNNYLVENAKPVPASCAEPAPGADPSCTHHPMRSWTIRKDSQPEDGAMIHSGGNIYYRVKVTNFSDGPLTGVQIADNMTQTLAAAVLDLGAPPAVSYHFGLSYYRADGSLIAGSHNLSWNGVNSGANPTVVFTAQGSVKPDGQTCNLAAEFVGSSSTVPAAAAGCWTFTTPVFDVPKELAGSKVAYAIVGYAVKGGDAAAAPGADPTTWGAVANTSVPIEPNAIWVNTVQAGSANLGGAPVYPSACSANANGGAGIPPGWEETEEFYDLWASCKTYHSIGESYFHIWKKDGTNVPGTDVDNNLVNSGFMLADTQEDAEQGRGSRWLCRVDNAPTSTDPAANLDWVPTPGSSQVVGGANPASGNPGAAWDYASTQPGGVNWWLNQTNVAREIWNLSNPGLPQKQILPVCGAFFHLDTGSQGQAAGSWRAIDVRGGDTVDGTAAAAPLSNWRTASALNVSGDASKGRHGTYWLVETVAPQNFQLLSKPMQMWVAPSSPSPGGLAPGTAQWYDYQGRLTLPVVGEGESASGATPMPGSPGTDGIALRQMCVNPWQLPANNQPNCVMPTGWTMPVFDVKMAALPLTGGIGPLALGLGGGAVLVAALLGAWWWRRRGGFAAGTRGGDHRA